MDARAPELVRRRWPLIPDGVSASAKKRRSTRPSRAASIPVLSSPKLATITVVGSQRSRVTGKRRCTRYGLRAIRASVGSATLPVLPSLPTRYSQCALFVDVDVVVRSDGVAGDEDRDFEKQYVRICSI